MWALLLLAFLDWTTAEQLVIQGRFREAQAALESLPKDTARWHLLASKIHDGLDDPARAVAEAEAALQLEPRNLPAHLQLGGIFLSRNTPDAALEVFNEALALEPGSLVARLGRGLALKELQLWDEAESELQQCWPNPVAFDAFATILLFRGKFEELKEWSTRFQQQVPQDFRGPYFLGASLDALNVEGAEAALRRAISLRPQFAAAHAALGKLYLKAGRLADAAISLQEAIRLRPDLTQAHLQLAQALQRQGRREEAAREFAIVRELKDRERQPRQRLLYHRGKKEGASR